MHESILRDYFIGIVDEYILKDDLKDTVVQTSKDVLSYKIIPLDAEFDVAPDHLAKLCDGVIAGKLQASDIETIGFCLAASDYFTWDSDTDRGSTVAATVYDWASPEINYPLTVENITKFRERLLTGKDLFGKNDTRESK